MRFLRFSVDTHLKIVQFDMGEDTTAGGGFQTSPYYELVPRIFIDEVDALGYAIKNRRSLFLEKYRFGCLFESFSADVRIEPIEDERNNITGAQVWIEIPEGCQFFNQLNKCRHLIDIGKNASLLAHGVRNPLNAIKGSVVYLKNRYGNEETLVQFANIMEEEISRLDKFISCFLSTSFENLDKKSVNINGILKHLQSFVFIQARTSGINLEFKFGDVERLNLNPFQIEQAILNVINNAINVLPVGGKILVESKKENKNNQDFIVVEISDNGPGFQEKGHHDFSSPLTLSGLTNGKGFGLFITREVMKHHDGRLEIKSDKTRGTAVRMLLPMKPKESD